MNHRKPLGPLTWIAAWSALALCAAPAGATTYVMMADEDLADQAAAIAVVRVTAIEPSSDAGSPATDYLARVERALKGTLARSLRARVRGGVAPDGRRFVVFGAPRFHPGERALLFLQPRDDGAYGVLQSMLGAFHEIASGGGRLAVRDLSETTEVALPGRRPLGPGAPRDFERFGAWLEDRAAGRARAPDYFTSGVAPPAPEYTQLGHGRWFEFDTGGGVPWFALAGGQAGMPGGGFTQFQNGLAAWNAEPQTPINLTYSGTTTNTVGTCNSVNVIRWNDPLNQIQGSFNCGTGGVLAQGGYCMSGTGTFNGQTFDRISDSDIVIQDGAGCFLQGHGNEDGEEVFGHELGHTLGLGHSCGDSQSPPCVPGSLEDQALMRAIAHGDGRGAALNADDQAGARFLYEPNTAPPTLSIADVTVTEANTTVNAVFTVSLSAAAGQTVQVSYATANNTALAGSDYTAVSGILSFAPGVLTQTITVPVLGDLLDEANETFFVNLSAPVGATLADGVATGTIVDDDPTPTLSVSDCSATEGNAGQVGCAFTVSLSAVSGQSVTVVYATANGTALAGQDYIAASGTLTLPAGSPSQQLTIAVLGDLLHEPNETFFVNLSSPGNAILADGQGLGTILDDDPAPAVSVSDCSVVEGDAGQTICTFTVSLSAVSGQDVSVGYATADGTALAGQDYLAASGTLVVPAGSPSQPVSVAVIGDLIDEPDEDFTLSLSSPVNATIADGQGEGTIIDNDLPPAVSAGDCGVVEGNTGSTPCDFTVTLSAPSGFTVSVSYATADGTATAPIDYTPAAGMLTFPPGTSSQTVPVQVVGDTLVEPDETFFLNLSGPVNASLGDAQGVGTIGDDDAPSLSSNELDHGSQQPADLLVRPDFYRIGQKPCSSYEVVVDGTSGDIVPVSLERLAGNNVAVLQSASPVAVGDSVSLRWENTTPLTVVNQHIRVDAACAPACGADDVYRIRAFETTYSIPRFNNSGSQVTVLLLQNPAAYDVTGHIWFWSTSGTLVGTQAFNLLARQTMVLNTATVVGVAGQGGTITVSHDGRYGDLAGKTVALEPSTGFSFDSPMSARPR